MSSLASLSHSDILETIFRQNPSFRPTQLRYNASAKTKVLNTLRFLPLMRSIVPSVDQREELIKKLLIEQKGAVTYKSWYDISAQLDELTGSNVWKSTPELPDYDYNLVHLQMNELKQARLNKDYKLLLYLVRTKWFRNFANMGSLSLYRHSHVGTKRLIEEYIEECQKALLYLVHDEDVKLDDRYLLGMLIQTRKNIGRTALLLSGGSTFGISHIGVLIALLENNLLPRVISGSSAGSVIASILCTHTNEETAQLLESILEKEFKFFGSLLNNSDGKLKSLLESISHFLKYGTVFDIGNVRDTIYSFVGDLTFREGYNRTGKILNITVSPASTHEQTRLLNYLTAPHCLIWSAVCASCSLPGIFASNSIYEKSPGTNTIREWNNDQSLKYVDGSVDGDLPITRLSEMFNVDHIIAVQVNPHVSPVLKVSVGNVGGKTDSEFTNSLRNVMNGCYDFILNEVIHYLQILHELNIQKNITSKMISILTQRYSGDITILPELDVSDFLLLFTNPTPKFILDFILKGARAAWPKITVINNHCGVEFALDKEISVLRGRIISNSNNRLTYSEPSAKLTILSRGASSNAYLISTPVLNVAIPKDIVDSEIPSANFRQRNPQIRRHNSTGFSGMEKRDVLARDTELSKGKRKLDDSSSSTPSKTVGSGIISHKSDANISGMNARYYEEESPEEPVGPARTRKALSSGSAMFENAFVASDKPNPFNFRTSPKHERSIHTSMDNGNFARKISGHESNAESSRRSETHKEKANLPKVLKANSTNVSGVGLNVLKEPVRSPTSSLNSTKDASSHDLRGYYMENEKTFRGLHSPDLRRQFSKTRLESDSYYCSTRYQNMIFAGAGSKEGAQEKSGSESRDTPFSSDPDSDCLISEPKSTGAPGNGNFPVSSNGSTSSKRTNTTPGGTNS
ncbi:TAG lipase / steryl ester hydrolase / phospholipase A2 / LPA acyltransferase [Metschnikowia aff. pulcherrima]|uniref:TAG lipase / steryl ester hydrolase / phospholipase A2 / LPA acyltransferase n=1 Tax=Metschnikowia aff. pulcherrima TaxID=2163413 RepID=A0A4P6XIW6_9ASCO|nr:TAG lipase / steryl ester hydrolase / phospholipase A2 / LPA acyltransferase [Metschnikowia aff. pulcherrima]